MVLPNLIHPVPCAIEQIDRPATLYDEDAREPVQYAARATSIVVPGQPRWTSERELEVAAGGPIEGARGYVLFRYADLVARGVTLAINDRITMQGQLIDEAYVVRLQPMGHYSDQNGASLVRAWVADRKPAKERA